MSKWDSEFSSAPSFHPEFGLLCPSERFLRRLRHATVVVAMGIVVVGGAALALVPQLGPRLDVVGDEGMRTSVGLLPENSASAAQNDPDTPDKTKVLAAMASVKLPQQQAPCNDLSGAFLSPQCQLGKAGRARLARNARAPGAAGQVPTVALGRFDPHPRTPAQVPASAPVREAAATVEAAAPVVLPPERPPLPPKKPEKPVKIVHAKPVPTARDRDIASVDAPPPPSSAGFDLLDLFRSQFGSGGGAWAMQR